MPGLAGEVLYRTSAGSDWREPEWRKVARVIWVSAGGLVLYILLSWCIAFLPSPLYVQPAALASASLSKSVFGHLALAYVGHTICAVIVGYAGGFIARILVSRMSLSPYPDTWDRFVNVLVPEHWIIVTLKSGETYFGQLKRADISVKEDERDMVLEEPALYDDEHKTYRSLPYQYLFLPGALIGSVAVQYDPKIDSRMIPPGQTVFPAQENDEQEDSIDSEDR